MLEGIGNRGTNLGSVAMGMTDRISESPDESAIKLIHFMYNVHLV